MLPSPAPRVLSGVLASQTATLLDERARLPIVVIDGAHLLTNTDLEALRMLMNSDMDTRSYFAMLLIGQPTLRRRFEYLRSWGPVSLTFGATG